MRFSPRRLLAVGPVSLTVASVLLVGALISIGVPIFDPIELRTYDLRGRSRGHRQSSPAVALAVIDEKSLDTEGLALAPRGPRGSRAGGGGLLSQDRARRASLDSVCLLGGRRVPARRHRRCGAHP